MKKNIFEVAILTHGSAENARVAGFYKSATVRYDTF